MSAESHNRYAPPANRRNPLSWLTTWLTPYKYKQTVALRQQPIQVCWTARCQRMLEQRQTPLLVEMQLYFSCVVKKRVLFHAHDTGDIEQTDEIVRVNDKLHVVFRAVQASSCDPVEFARHYPVKQEFRTRPALKMYPSRLKLDYPQDGWLGEFSI